MDRYPRNRVVKINANWAIFVADQIDIVARADSEEFQNVYGRTKEQVLESLAQALRLTVEREIEKSTRRPDAKRA